MSRTGRKGSAGGGERGCAGGEMTRISLSRVAGPPTGCERFPYGGTIVANIPSRGAPEGAAECARLPLTDGAPVKHRNGDCEDRLPRGGERSHEVTVSRHGPVHRGVRPLGRLSS